MNNKEIREIKRRFRCEHSNVQELNVCYVSSSGEIISSFRQSMAMLDTEEQEKYLRLFQKCLSGSQGKQLHSLDFSTAQVAGSEEHGLLMSLKNSKLKDNDSLNRLYDAIIRAVSFDSNYAILAAFDTYDVPKANHDGSFDAEGGDSVFSYFIVAVCPVKLSKNELTYIPDEKEFHNKGTDSILGAPEIGFLFPSFDDRTANIYSTLYYTKNSRDSSEPFVDSIFRLKAPFPAQLQKEAFGSTLSEALAENCTADTVKAVQALIGEKIQIVKESHLPDVPTVTRLEISDLLEEQSVPEEKIADFNVRFDSAFGSGADVSAPNLINPKRIELKTSDAVVQIDAEHASLLETRFIGENRYIMIRVQDGDGVYMNGVEISIQR